MSKRIRVLFVCSGNSCRSQMAEGWARHLKSDVVEAFSAGVSVHGLNRIAVRVMAEAGVNISHHRSKTIQELGRAAFDYVVTVCSQAEENCPVFPGRAKLVHAPFDDPPLLARSANSEEEALDCYRRVRDEIRAFVEDMPEKLALTARSQVKLGNESCECETTPKGNEPMGTQENTLTDSEAVRATVREGYGQIARAETTGCAPAKKCCGGTAPNNLATSIGYDEAELATLPEGANMGLSCGNPTAIAALKPGEVLVDLGSGGGFDAFIAGPKVGPTGRVIGVDMTADMIAKARRNLKVYQQRTGLDNVEFRLGEIEHLPVADDSVDVIISNCVINLSPDKPQVWREMARVLKPGGRVAVSDIALLRPLPEEILRMVEALVGCVAGAVLSRETERMAREAGLVDVVLTPKNANVDAMADWQDPMYRKIVEHLPAGTKPGDFVTSLDVSAKKPLP